MTIYHVRALARLAVTGLLVLYLLMSASPAYGHKVSIFAWVEAGTVHTESKFSGGKRVKGGKIDVFDHQGRRIHTGTTNNDGYHGFAVPAGAEELKIVLTAGMGHTNHWTLHAEELGASGDSATINQSQAAVVQSSSPIAADSSPDRLDAKTIETIVERVVERKLAPIRSQLTSQNWTLHDILAGLGYILGLMGLASYIHFRKQAPGPKDP
jgi:nickel transport protein